MPKESNNKNIVPTQKQIYIRAGLLQSQGFYRLRFPKCFYIYQIFWEYLWGAVARIFKQFNEILQEKWDSNYNDINYAVRRNMKLKYLIESLT